MRGKTFEIVSWCGSPYPSPKPRSSIYFTLLCDYGYLAMKGSHVSRSVSNSRSLHLLPRQIERHKVSTWFVTRSMEKMEALFQICYGMRRGSIGSVMKCLKALMNPYIIPLTDTSNAVPILVKIIEENRMKETVFWFPDRKSVV